MPRPWAESGCEKCRMMILAIKQDPLVYLGRDISGFATLHRCNLCQTLWVSEPRIVFSVTEDEAKRDFPDVSWPDSVSR